VLHAAQRAFAPLVMHSKEPCHEQRDDPGKHDPTRHGRPKTHGRRYPCGSTPAVSPSYSIYHLDACA
jgi:hypothetical protein